MSFGLLMTSKAYLYFDRKYSRKCPLNHEQQKKSDEFQKKIQNSQKAT